MVGLAEKNVEIIGARYGSLENDSCLVAVVGTSIEGEVIGVICMRICSALLDGLCKEDTLTVVEVNPV